MDDISFNKAAIIACHSTMKNEVYQGEKCENNFGLCVTKALCLDVRIEMVYVWWHYSPSLCSYRLYHTACIVSKTVTANAN